MLLTTKGKRSAEGASKLKFFKQYILPWFVKKAPQKKVYLDEVISDIKEESKEKYGKPDSKCQPG